MTTTERNTLVESVIDLVPWQASRFTGLPPGITAEDLESAGHEALMHAAVTWDADLGVPWRSYARVCLKNAMRRVIAKARTRRQVPLEIETGDGTFMPRPDARACDPGAIASAREHFIGPPARRRRHHVGLSDSVPDPSVIAARASELREAMFAAIAAEDVTAIVRKVAEKARAGDLKAARLLFDLLAPSRSGTTIVHQQAVVIHRDDLAS